MAKKEIFICQVGDHVLKVLVASEAKGFLTSHREILPLGVNQAELQEKIKAAFSALGYKSNPLVICLGRVQATCRLIKIPSRDNLEIEKIAKLQASRFLPYPAEELISGFEVVSSDQQGYSLANQVIAHREVISRQISLFQPLNPQSISIFLSSLGVANLWKQVFPKDDSSVMVVDMDYLQAEAVIIEKGKMLFSRGFKLENDAKKPLAEGLAAEINKTQNLFSKESSLPAPQKIFLLGADAGAMRIADSLRKDFNLMVEAASYFDKISFSQKLDKNILSGEVSFAGLIGLGMGQLSQNLNLLPDEFKRAGKMVLSRQQYLRKGLIILATLSMLLAGVIKDFDNRTAYLNKLNNELLKVSHEAKPLEELDRRIKLLSGRLSKSSDILSMIKELYQIMPPEVSLSTFSFEVANQVALRGVSGSLNPVFDFAAGLGKSPAFSSYNIKVRYASKKITQAGEVVEYEIICSKEK